MKILDGKKVLILGLGESGVSAAMLLRALGAKVRVTDSSCREEVLKNAESLSSSDIEVEIGSHSKNFFKNMDFAILSPGIPWNAEIVDRLRAEHISVFGELDWASQLISDRVIAVTGSNGKSTTSTLIWNILKKQGLAVSLAGNIGKSLSRVICEELLSEEDRMFSGNIHFEPDRIWVLEVSSFQLESAQFFKPWISILLNLSPNHLDRYSSFAEYVGAKEGIFKNQKESDWSIIHRSFQSMVHPRSRELFVSSVGTEENGAFIQDGLIKISHEGTVQDLISLREIPIRGIHYAEDAMFAALAAFLCGVKIENIREAIIEFKGLEHRQEIFGMWENVTWVNDSKSTSVDAVRKALETFNRPVIWIAGGHYKGGDFGALKDLVIQKVRESHFYGEAAHLIAEKFKGIGPVFIQGPLKDTLKEVRSRIKPGDTVLFSPGCSSFDQFKNFEERGRFFKAQIKRAYELADSSL